MQSPNAFPELWKFGSHERATRGTPLHLTADCTASAGARRWSTMRRIAVTSGYAVTAGQVLLITRVLYNAATAGLTWEFSYGDTDVGRNGAAEPTNEIKLDAMIATTRNVLVALAANTLYDVPYYLEIPAGKYLTILHTNGSVQLWVAVFGHEVPA